MSRVRAELESRCHSIEDLLDAARAGDDEALLGAVDALAGLREAYAADHDAFESLVPELRQAGEVLRATIEAAADGLAAELVELDTRQLEIERRGARLRRALAELFREHPRQEIVFEEHVVRLARARDPQSGRPQTIVTAARKT